jgi:hypothetical protein
MAHRGGGQKNHEDYDAQSCIIYFAFILSVAIPQP